mmetsp:Transcript_96237/g.206553  ORF Transcript_96237/g.206553 Transcript_96237/m.206553 type:complete len:566 (+) Transcript_96237:936-2633(+)
MRRLANKLPEVVQRDGRALPFLLLHPHEAQGHLPCDLLQELPQFSYAGLSSVVADELRHSLGPQVHVILLDAMVLYGLGDKVLVRDLELLLENVAGESDDLHAIEKRPRHSVGDVGSAYEKHPREVHGHVHVEIPEARILCRVEDLQERRGGVAPVVPTELVHLIDENHGVRNLCDLQSLNHLPWHGTHVGAPVAPDLRHIVETAHGKAKEFAIQGPGDTFADGGLADARRSDQAHDLPLTGALEKADRHVFQDPLLHVLKTVVVLVEDALSAIDGRVVLCRLAPRQSSHPFQIRPTDVELGRLGLQAAKSAELLLHGLASLFRHIAQLLNVFFELRNDGLLVVALQIELALDVAQVLHEHVLPVLLREFVFDLAFELGLQPCLLQILLHDHEHLSEARYGHVRHKHRLELVPRSCGHAGDEIRKLQGVVKVVILDHLLELIPVQERRLQQVLHSRDDLVVQRPYVVVVRGHLHIWDVFHVDRTERGPWRRLGQRTQQLDPLGRHHDHLPAGGAWMCGEADNLQQCADVYEVLARINFPRVAAKALRRRRLPFGPSIATSAAALL